MGGIPRKILVESNSGVTLVELIIALTLLLVVLSLTLSFVTYMQNSSKVLSQQAEAQENVIISKAYIDERIRNASSLIIIGGGDDAPASWTETIFLDVVDGRGVIFTQKKDGQVSPILSNLANEYSMQLSFKRTADNFIKVFIACVSEDGLEYFLDNEIFLLGFEPHQFIGESGERIYIYSK